jgi:hypothetical protein
MTAFRASYQRFREQISQSPRSSLNLRSDRDRKAYLSRFNPQVERSAKIIPGTEPGSCTPSREFGRGSTAQEQPRPCLRRARFCNPCITNVVLELCEGAAQLASPTRLFGAHSPIRQETGAAPGVASMVSREVGRWQLLMLLLRPMAGSSAGDPYSMLQWQCRDKKRLGVNLYLDRRY